MRGLEGGPRDGSPTDPQPNPDSPGGLPARRHPGGLRNRWPIVTRFGGHGIERRYRFNSTVRGGRTSHTRQRVSEPGTSEATRPMSASAGTEALVDDARRRDRSPGSGYP